MGFADIFHRIFASASVYVDETGLGPMCLSQRVQNRGSGGPTERHSPCSLGPCSQAASACAGPLLHLGTMAFSQNLSISPKLSDLESGHSYDPLSVFPAWSFVLIIGPFSKAVLLCCLFLLVFFKHQLLSSVDLFLWLVFHFLHFCFSLVPAP